MCLLKRPLYSFVQSGHIWFKLLKEEYKSLGYYSSKMDLCVYLHCKDPNFSITTMYTNDIFSTLSSNEETNKVIYEFVLKWDLTEVNDHNLLLGLTVKCFENRDISLSQSMYFECILKYFNL